jgi:hypothetical protein
MVVRYVEHVSVGSGLGHREARFLGNQCTSTYALCENKCMTLQQIIEILRAFMLAGAYNEVRFSIEAGVPQSTLHRSLRSPKRLTKTHRKLCKFAGIDIDETLHDARAQEALWRAVRDVWDGTPEHAHAIARLLKAGANVGAHRAADRRFRMTPHART